MTMINKSSLRVLGVLYYPTRHLSPSEAREGGLRTNVHTTSRTKKQKSTSHVIVARQHRSCTICVTYKSHGSTVSVKTDRTRRHVSSTQLNKTKRLARPRPWPTPLALVRTKKDRQMTQSKHLKNQPRTVSISNQEPSQAKVMEEAKSHA